MSALSKVKLILVTGAFALILSGCAKTPTDADLKGMWQTEPFSTPRGMSVEMICFGNGNAATMVSQVQSSAVRRQGTYKLVGDQLTIESPDMEKPTTRKATLKLGKLVLSSPNGSSLEYARGMGNCEK